MARRNGSAGSVRPGAAREADSNGARRDGRRRTGPVTDHGCDTWQEAISAAADGAAAGVDLRLVEAHLRRCPACRTFADAIDEQRLVAHAIGRSPGLSSGEITAAVARDDRTRVPAVLRIGLVLVAAHLTVLAAIDLIAPEGHEARHVGSFSLAYAIALLVVALRPARARTVLPVAVVVAAALAITAVVDTVQGSTQWLTELRHVPEIAGVVLVWALCRRIAPPAPRPTRSPSQVPGVRR